MQLCHGPAWTVVLTNVEKPSGLDSTALTCLWLAWYGKRAKFVWGHESLSLLGNQASWCKNTLFFLIHVPGITQPCTHHQRFSPLYIFLFYYILFTNIQLTFNCFLFCSAWKCCHQVVERRHYSKVPPNRETFNTHNRQRCVLFVIAYSVYAGSML